MEEDGGGQSPTYLVEDPHLGPIPSKSPPEAEAPASAGALRRFRLTMIGPDEKRGIGLLRSVVDRARWRR